MQLTEYLVLPPEITPFERRFLSRLNKIALVFFYLHIPVLMAVAWAAGTGPLFALALSLLVLAGPTVAYRTIPNPRSVSVVYGITAMFMGALLVHFGQGPVQIEMHFYFFALLAMLCMFANPTVNLAAAATVALHHLAVWWFLPTSVFNYDAQWWVVLVHAAFVVLETVAACYISREFFDNVVGLERIVEVRTAAIREHQRDMRLILNNLQEGLIIIDLDGRMSGETSRVVKQWFGLPKAGETLAAWLGQKDATFSEWLDLALEGVKEGILPTEVALFQLPKRLKNGNQSYTVEYQVMTHAGEGPERDSVHPGDGSKMGQGQPDKLLVIISDITELLSREATERQQSDLLEVFQHMMRDKSGFLEFLAEADYLVQSLTGGHYQDLDHFKRLVHTLKGNSAIFGMRRISGICHVLESEMAEHGQIALGADMADLGEAWSRIRSDIEKLLGEAPERNIELNDSEYNAILNAIRANVDVQTLARMIESLRLEPTGRRLERIEQQIKGLAERMGKRSVAVLIEPNDLRFNSQRFAPFWSAFIHVLRNAVDHGVEAPEERQRSGKPEHSLIKVTTAIKGDSFVVTVEDDGPGVDWERLRTKAGGVTAAGARDDSVDLICLPGLSSKDTITELSGLGVGMSAVADACRALGGTLDVLSQRGTGTRVEFAFPKSQGVYEGPAAILQSAVTPVVA